MADAADVILDDDLIQITASNSEIQQRIERFMRQKRELINRTNLLDFCVKEPSAEDFEFSCARVDAILVRRKNSKSHLKVRRVYNTNGPSVSYCQQNTTIPGNPLQERLSNLEHHLSMNQPIPKDIYERIKQIEARVLELETMSPEYSQFWKNVPATPLPPMERVLQNSSTSDKV